MIPRAETDPFYLPVINLSGETVPPFALMKIIGMDANSTVQISKPDRDNDNSGLLANSDFPIGDNKTGQGRMVMPFVVNTNGEGSPPSRDEIWGTENGSWFLSRDRIGFKVLAVAANSTRVLVEKMQTQYIASLRVTSASNATGPNLSDYYPVVERYLDSVNQTYTEGPTGYLKLSSAPTVNQTFFGYRDGCNVLPTYRPMNLTSSSSNGGGSGNITGSNVDRVRLLTKVNNTTWNGTLLLPDPANASVTSGPTINISIFNTALIDNYRAGQEIVVQNTTASNVTLRLPEWSEGYANRSTPGLVNGTVQRFDGNKSFSSGNIGLGNNTANAGFDESDVFIKSGPGDWGPLGNDVGVLTLESRSKVPTTIGTAYLHLTVPVAAVTAVCYVNQANTNTANANTAFGVYHNGTAFVGKSEVSSNCSGMLYKGLGPNGTLWVFYNTFMGGLLTTTSGDESLTTDLIWYTPGNQTLTEFLATL